MSPIQSLCPNKHHLPTPVRQGARSVKTSEESSRFEMPEGHDWLRDHILALVSQDPSVKPIWEPRENRGGMAADCLAQSRIHLNSI